MSMGLSMQPEMTLEVRMDLAEERITEIRHDLDEHTKLLIGDLDKRQEGLVFVIADLGKLIEAHTGLITMARKDIEERSVTYRKEVEDRIAQHLLDGHVNERRSNWSWDWSRLGFSIADHVLSAIAISVLVLLALGALTFIQHGCIAQVACHP